MLKITKINFKEFCDNPYPIITPIFKELGYTDNKCDTLAEIWCNDGGYLYTLMDNYTDTQNITLKKIKNNIITAVNQGKCDSVKIIKKYNLTKNNWVSITEKNWDDGLINSWVLEFITEYI